MTKSLLSRSLTLSAKEAGSHYDEVIYHQTTPEHGQCDREQLTSAAVARTPRPGTTMRTPAPKTSQGRIPPGTRSRARTATARGRTAMTSGARAATAALGSHAPTPLRADIAADARQFRLTAKYLFEYIFYYEGDIRKAMELAMQALAQDDQKDWWWKVAMARCYQALDLGRQAEEQLRQTLKQQHHLTTYLILIGIYVNLDQPISALEICRQGLQVHSDDTSLRLERARVLAASGSAASAVAEYRAVAASDATNAEAVAGIAVHNFYSDQPEMALRYYRRILATSGESGELYNNIALCCLHSGQWDLTLSCFRHALRLAVDVDTRANIWYNLAHLAMMCGDLRLACQCIRICLALDASMLPARNILTQLNKLTHNK